MRELLLELEKAIANGQENAKNVKRLYQLLSSYNAYCILLLQAKQELERKKGNIKEYYSDSYCYEKHSDVLLSLFKTNECLIGKPIELNINNKKDRLFLIDKDTLLRINSFDNNNSTISGLSHMDYELIKINDCTAKLYQEKVLRLDPHDYEMYSTEEIALRFFDKNKPITPGYVLDSQFCNYHNKDIREILKVQSLDNIYEKITAAKDKKEKKLILTR